jgi:hypothetical protein
MDRNKPKLVNGVVEPAAGQVASIRYSENVAKDDPGTKEFRGRICVVGTDTKLGLELKEVKARVFRQADLAGLTDTPHPQAVDGVVIPEGASTPTPHNYRFIRNDPRSGSSHHVPDARDNHTPGGDPDNHLVVWTRFEGEGFVKREIVQFLGDGDNNVTSCEGQQFPA